MASRLEEEKIAARYAKALFESASEAGEVDAVGEDLNAVSDIFDALSSDLNSYLSNPAIPIEDKVSFVESQIASKVHPRVGNLLKLMTQHDRLNAFSALVLAFWAQVRKHNNIATAELITAVELPATLMKKAQKTLEAVFDFKKIELEHRVDPGILGGAVIKLNDRVIDGSYIGKLEALKKYVG